MVVQPDEDALRVGTVEMAENDPHTSDLLVRALTRIDDKLDNVLSRLGKLESGHEQIEALQAAHAKANDRIQDHDIRLTKIETKGGMIASIVAAVVSLVVALTAAMFKAYAG